MQQEVAMKVSEAMTRDVRVANPEETIRQAAKTMATLDAGVLPVGENDHLIGMITDRDIAIRGIAQGKGPKAKVRDVMTEDSQILFRRSGGRRGHAQYGRHSGATPAGP